MSRTQSATALFTGSQFRITPDQRFELGRADSQTVSVPAHVRTVVETFAFTYRGNGSGSGAATVRVMSPANLSSLPVDVKYACP